VKSNGTDCESRHLGFLKARRSDSRNLFGRWFSDVDGEPESSRTLNCVLSALLRSKTFDLEFENLLQAWEFYGKG
jgi:hypothetical protein